MTLPYPAQLLTHMRLPAVHMAASQASPMEHHRQLLHALPLLCQCTPPALIVTLSCWLSTAAMGCLYVYMLWS